jgi:ribonucleoside-diphosphate reductase beta chain
MKKILDGETATINQLVGAEDTFPYELWLKGVNNNWMPVNVPMGDDILQWKTKDALSEDEKLLVRRTIGFFSGGESLVGNNLVISAYRFLTDGGCRQYLARQIFEESLHNGTVKVCCECFSLDQDEVAEAYKNIPAVKAKDDFLMSFTTDIGRREFDISTIEGKREFIRNLFAFYIICEGIFFYSGFAMILALGRQGKLNGLCDQIKYTLRDETLHIQFGVYALNRIKADYPEVWTPDFEQELVAALNKAIDLEIIYAKEVLPNGILGLNADMFVDYMKFIGNRRLESLGIKHRYDSDKNPFPWLGEVVDVKAMGAFFERHERGYQPSSALEDDF